MKLLTTVSAASDRSRIMTYGIYDRFLSWLINSLHEYHERRKERLWDQAERPAPENPRKLW